MINIKTITEIDLYISKKFLDIPYINGDVYRHRGAVEGVDFIKNALIDNEELCEERIVFLLDCMKKKLECEKLQKSDNELYINWMVGYINSLEWFLYD